MNAQSDALGLSGRGRIAVVDFSKELAAGKTPPCIAMEHRNGKCPLGLKHDTTIQETPNTVVDSLKTSIIDQATGTGTPLDLSVTAIACGTSSDPTTGSMTQLAAEYYRTTTIEVKKTGPKTFSVYWFLGTTVGNAPSDLKEWGILAGGATATPGSGTKIARFLQTFAKNSGNTVSGQYDFTVA